MRTRAPLTGTLAAPASRLSRHFPERNRCGVYCRRRADRFPRTIGGDYRCPLRPQTKSCVLRPAHSAPSGGRRTTQTCTPRQSVGSHKSPILFAPRATSTEREMLVGSPGNTTQIVFECIVPTSAVVDRHRVARRRACWKAASDHPLFCKRGAWSSQLCITRGKTADTNDNHPANARTVLKQMTDARNRTIGARLPPGADCGAGRRIQAGRHGLWLAERLNPLVVTATEVDVLYVADAPLLRV
jgi:hypothetical protein